MICAKCRIAADLMEAAGPLFDEREGAWGGVLKADALMALAVAAAIVRLHTECDGSETGCPCQHRGTGAYQPSTVTRQPGRHA